MSVGYFNCFSSSFFKQLYISQNSTGNIVFSGISFYVLMGAIQYGLQGRSYNQLSAILLNDFDKLDDPKLWSTSRTAIILNKIRYISESFLNVRSLLFYSCDLNDHFEQVSSLIFKLSAFKIDNSTEIQTAHGIHEWMLETDYRSFVNHFNESNLSEGKLLYINEFTFHADWKINFDPRFTKLEDFFDEYGKPIQVEMMSQKSYNLIFYSNDYNFKILFKELRYENLYSAIVLPRKGHNILNVLKKIKIDQIRAYFQKSQLKYTKLKLPKFKISGHIDVARTLKQFGITDIFDKNKSDFGRMTNQTVFVGNLIHVSNLIIDDLDSTEAATTRAKDDQSMENPFRFYVKKPFLFLVYYETMNIVILSAVVTNPAAT
ncbi:Glia-derived nexin [Thelohanellus kitauei]|uniref:Glia-derived nexin n=1 Tax=Thelohanellus kitauei TaxID=669202 RepID=A0A0C2MN25_THEKT|nr:Glia-derived nexin [Thelohanellus kitauei]